MQLNRSTPLLKVQRRSWSARRRSTKEVVLLRESLHLLSKTSYPCTCQNSLNLIWSLIQMKTWVGRQRKQAIWTTDTCSMHLKTNKRVSWDRVSTAYRLRSRSLTRSKTLLLAKREQPQKLASRISMTNKLAARLSNYSITVITHWQKSRVDLRVRRRTTSSMIQATTRLCNSFHTLLRCACIRSAKSMRTPMGPVINKQWQSITQIFPISC